MTNQPSPGDPSDVSINVKIGHAVDVEKIERDEDGGILPEPGRIETRT
jgi:hypothetical protein